MGLHPHPHSAPPFANFPGPLPAQLHSPIPSFGGQPSSLPFPTTFGNVTSSVVNTPTPPVQQNTRKRKNALSNTNPPAKKRIVPRTSSNTSTPANPVVSTETICGVGPATSAATTAASISVNSPAMAPPHLPVTAPSTRQLSGHQYAEKLTRRSTASDKKAATDVWFFLEPLTADETDLGQESPLPITADIQTMKPLIMSKPDEKKYPRLKCRLCPKLHTWTNKSGVTGSVRAHLKQAPNHFAIYMAITQRLGLKHADDPDPVDPSSYGEPFTVEGWVDRLVRWVVVDDQSINVVDNGEFRDFALYGRDDLRESDLPHRTALTQHIAAAYNKHHQDMKFHFKAALGRHSFTADIWSDGNLTSFMALSDHYMTRDENGHLVMKSVLLAFRVIEGAHDGEHLADIIYAIWKEAGLLHVLGQFTLDNAGNNNTTLRRLVELLRRDGINYSEDGNRVRCFPHVINIATQTIIKELKENPMQPIRTDVEGASAPSSDPIEREATEEYVQALVADPVGKGRNMVAACRKSGQRRSDLRTVIENGNDDGSWTMRLLQLLRDCETRWSSTYLMNDRVLYLYPAVTRFLELPKHIDLIHLLFTQTEYQVLHDIQAILRIPHLAQELLSAEKTPTLSMALPAYEMIIIGWLNLQKEIPVLAHYIGVGIHKLQEYVALGRKSRIYALAMLINPEVKLDWIKTHWSSEDATNAKEWMIEAMTSFATSRRHATRVPAPIQRSSTAPTAFSSSSQTDTAAQRQAHGLTRLSSLGTAQRQIVSLPRAPSRPTTITNQDSLSRPSATPAAPTPAPTPLTPAQIADRERRDLQLDRVVAEKEFLSYVSRGLEKDQTLVRYWDLNEKELPLMFSVAMDVLPVQASAVPCERVFSSSKETTTLRRSCLSPGLMEMLQVLKYAYKQERLDFTEDWIAKEEDYTIDGNVTEAAVRELMSDGKVQELYELLTGNSLPVPTCSWDDDDWSPETEF